MGGGGHYNLQSPQALRLLLCLLCISVLTRTHMNRFLTLYVTDLISSYPTHWSPKHANGTFCCSSHRTAYFDSFSQICKHGKLYSVICKLEAKFLCQKFFKGKKTGNNLQIIKMHGFCNFLIFSFMPLIPYICFSYFRSHCFFIWSFLLKI